MEARERGLWRGAPLSPGVGAAAALAGACRGHAVPGGAQTPGGRSPGGAGTPEGVQGAGGEEGGACEIPGIAHLTWPQQLLGRILVS